MLFTRLFFIVAYSCAVIACVVVARREKSLTRAGHPGLLYLLGTILLLYDLEKLVGAFRALSQIGRLALIFNHLYAGRRALQVLLVIGTPIIGILVLFVLLWWVRRETKRYLPVIIAIVYAIFFAVLQMISLHDLDALFDRRDALFRLGGWGNLIGLAFVVFALFYLERTRKNASRRA